MKRKTIFYLVIMTLMMILFFYVKSYAVTLPEIMITSNSYSDGDKMNLEDVNNVEIGKTLQLYAVIAHGNDVVLDDDFDSLGWYVDEANLSGVTWASSNTSIATIDNTGKVTGIAEGTATITADYTIRNTGTTTPEKHFKAEYTVTVKSQSSYTKPIYYLEVTGEVWIPAGETTQLQAKYWEQEGVFEEGKEEPTEIKNDKKNEENVTNKVIWKSSDSSVATVDNKGLLKGIKEGTVKISATQNIGNLELKAEHTIEIKTVNQQEKFKLKIMVENGKNTINKDETIQLKAIRINEELGVNMEEDMTSLVKWTSSNPSIATVDNKGIVKGMKAGKVTIIAKYTIEGEEKEAQYEITVQEKNSTITNPSPEDNTTSKEKIPNTGVYRNITIITIIIMTSIISFAVSRKYKNIK